MANEYLKRTPTSTGNRKIFTYAGWFKKNNADGSTRFDIFNAYNTGNQQEEVGFRADTLRYLSSGSSLYGFDTTNKYRDTGNWFHIVFALNTTLESERKRSVIYINGVEVDTTTSSGIGAYVAKNFDSIAFNVAGKEHNVLARKYSSSGRDYAEGGAFDIFFVDGQALTPDVFGFYKDGDGYQSSGTSQVTDFRPGQWSPHSPRKIKTEIERKGGFGVNGFYLPMNDSSNPGADFHCAPNSIIKLNGEDLPQPRNGLPTTSDNYVSQLREDPYAANLVLAVPGVNTQPTGSELITNGTFDTNVSGWTITDTGTIVRQSDGTAKVTRGSSAEVVYQDITTVVGTTYELSVDITDIGGSHGQVYVKSTPHSGSLNTNIGYSFYPGTYKGTFTADTTTTRIYLYAHPSGYSSYDNVSVKATTIPDYSANIKGSGTNKTITAYADASVRNPHQRNGRHVNGYYGSALSLDGTGDVLKTASHADFNLGNGDYTIEGWYYDQESAINTGSRCYWAIGGVNAEGTLALFRENAYLMLRGRSPGDGAYTNIIYVTNHNIPVGQWNHICTERYNGVITVYINGVAIQTNRSESTTVSQGYFTIGAFSSGGSYPYHGYIQDVRVYKGVAKYKGGFDVPKPYAPENSDTNKGIQTWRQVPDNCKNNFATWNPLLGPQGCALAGGNLTVTSDGANNHKGTRSTMGMSSGKWYWEYRVGTVAVNSYVGVSEYMDPDGLSGTNYIVSGQGGHNYVSPNGSFSVTDSSLTTGMIIGCAFDRDASTQQLKVYKNGSLAVTGTCSDLGDGVLYLAHNSFNAAVSDGWEGNFGQNPTFSGTVTAGTYTDSNGKGLFKYQPPAGYLALCEDNLPTPAIADPGEHFKTVLWTGDGKAGRGITGLGFKPDLVWIKDRGDTSSHSLFDSVRGAGIWLGSNSTSAEQTSYVNVYNPSFNDDGFGVGTDGAVNGSGSPYVAWCWKAGGAAVSNTDGGITAQVSANQTAGFSIVSYTGNGTAGANVGHGLLQAPELMIHKSRDQSRNWYTITTIVDGSPDYLYLNNTNQANNSAVTAPTSSLMYFTSSVESNNLNEDYIAYCWHSVEGYSKFGSYKGNGNADGPFVYCGFKPAWVLIKKTNGSGNENWRLFDSSRCPTNQNNKHLLPSSNNAESTESGMDFVSNGFKLRHADAHQNQSGTTYIFAAFAESPFQTANAK